jgi:hypothetical protein
MTAGGDRWFLGVIAVAAMSTIHCSGEVRVRLLEPLPGDAVDSGSAPGVDGLRAQCSRWTATLEPEQALLMLVIDVSGSMSTPSTAQSTRWGVERPILGTTVDALPGGVGVGVLYYPNMATPPSTVPRPVSACVNTDATIPVDLLGSAGSRQRTRIQRSLATTEPNAHGGTPTLDAYLAGLEELGRTTLAGTRQMLLITDGQPTFSEGCVGSGQVNALVDVAPVVDAVANAHRAGIDTFVIGSPGSEQVSFGGNDARPWLSQAAEAGGTAVPGCSDTGPHYCHFDLVTQPDLAQGLQTALGDIASRIVRCDFPLPEPPQNESLDLQTVNVVLTASGGKETLLANDASSSCMDGWQYSADHQRIVLCPDTCTLVRAELGSKLESFVGCPTVVR